MRAQVLNGMERRRRWPQDEKMRILEETLAPGACVSEIARRYGVATGLLFTWRRQARTETSASPTPALLPVEVAACSCREPAQASLSKQSKGGVIEIDLGSGRCVRVDAQVDEHALARVLRVLGRR